MCSCELVTMVTAIACCIAKDRSQEELELLAAMFAQLGDTLATIVVCEGQQTKCNSEEDTEEASEVGSLI